MNKKSILEKMGFAQLNSMQSKAYEAISQDNRDVILLSPTGTGKTLAYLLPLVEMLDMSSAATQVLVIVHNGIPQMFFFSGTNKRNL